MEKLVFPHSFISLVNGSSDVPYIFNVIFLKEEILLHLWRYPSLSIHGIEGAFHEPGIKTVIPAKVIGKFSIRQVPHMDLSVVKQQVKGKLLLGLCCVNYVPQNLTNLHQQSQTECFQHLFVSESRSGNAGVSLSCKMNTFDCNVFSPQVVEHLEGVFSKRNSPNKLKVSMPLGAKPWLADVNNPLYIAARRAIKTGMFLPFFSS